MASAQVKRLVVSVGGLLTAGCLAVAAGWAMLSGFHQVPAAEPGPHPGDPHLARAIATRAPVGEPDQLPIDALSIPALKIRATMVAVTITDHDFPVPADPATVGISTTGAPLCAVRGTTLVAGHVASRGVQGALWPLAAVRKGALLHVHCADGSLATYQATGTPTTPLKQDLDPALDTTRGPHRLVVVTCGGPVMANGHYRDNVVAEFTRLR